MTSLRGREDQILAQWGDDDVTRQYVVGEASNVTDPGEAAAFAALDEVLDSSRVLDLGIGAGRTTRLLADRTDQYLGLDVAPEMVALAHSGSPDADLRVGDARDLSCCADDSVDVVVFSYNGIDAVDHDGRISVLRESHRVLHPGGYLVFSSLNRDAPGWPEKPWQFAAPGSHGLSRLRSVGWEAAREARNLRRTVRSWAHYVAMRHLHQDGPDWSRRLMRSHEFRFLIHFAPVPATAALVREQGFEIQHAWANQGYEVSLDQPDHEAGWVHYLCQR